MAEADDNSQLIRDAGIFYNLYEDDAITWYQNQLIASASTANAVTDMGIELAYLKSQVGKGGGGSCGASTDLGDMYALKNHTHDYMRNLVDSEGEGNGAVCGIDTVPEQKNLVISKFDQSSVPGDNIGTGTVYSYDEQGKAIVDPTQIFYFTANPPSKS